MNTKVLLILILALASVAVIINWNASQKSINLRETTAQEFQSWKQQNGIKYQSEEEESFRFVTFEQNVEKVKELSKEEPEATFSYKNIFADLNQREFQNRYLKYSEQKAFQDGVVEQKIENLGSNPDSVDWRQKGIIGPSITFQLQDPVPVVVSDLSGSIYAMKNKKNYTQLSFAQIYDCYSQSQNITDGYGYILKYGLESFQDYQKPMNSCQYDASKVVYKPVSVTKVPTNDLDALETAVSMSPVSVKVDGTSWQFYSGGVLKRCGDKPNHNALIVGYDNKEDYWIMKNYWGQQWGYDGYIYVEKTSGKGMGVCGEATNAYYPN